MPKILISAVNTLIIIYLPVTRLNIYKRLQHFTLDWVCFGNVGWGGRDRTCEWRHQKPLPYRLATPQQATVVAECRGLYRLNCRVQQLKSGKMPLNYALNPAVRVRRCSALDVHKARSYLLCNLPGAARTNLETA